MKAASREAQSHVTDTLDELIRNADNTVAVAAQIGTELFLVVDQLDAERALQCNLVTKVVPHDRLMEEAELMARHILRNSQRAVRSAKETILEVIGRPLDAQLRIEGWNSYTCVDRD